jgi:bacillopeptidase F (M6 metalloprotease family)
VVLPTGQDPVVLRFWNSQSFESTGTGTCWDGGIVEISTNGGTTWTQILGANLLTDPYDGPIESGSSNPLAGLSAWCGDPQAYLRSIVDLTAWAGQTVKLRFRLGSDVSVGRADGWNLDDVAVQS